MLDLPGPLRPLGDLPAPLVLAAPAYAPLAYHELPAPIVHAVDVYGRAEPTGAVALRAAHHTALLVLPRFDALTWQVLAALNARELLCGDEEERTRAAERLMHLPDAHRAMLAPLARRVSSEPLEPLVLDLVFTVLAA